MRPCKLQVRHIRRAIHERGYIEPSIEDFQQLGYRTWWGGFEVVDEEMIPGDVAISLGAFGDCGRAWRSKFADYIPQARGGNA